MGAFRPLCIGPRAVHRGAMSHTLSRSDADLVAAVVDELGWIPSVDGKHIGVAVDSQTENLLVSYDDKSVGLSEAMTTMERITANPAARAAVSRLRAARGTPVMFVQSGGCCAGSTPMCLPGGELIDGDGDVLLGEIDGCTSPDRTEDVMSADVVTDLEL